MNEYSFRRAMMILSFMTLLSLTACSNSQPVAPSAPTATNQNIQTTINININGENIKIPKDQFQQNEDGSLYSY